MSAIPSRIGLSVSGPDHPLTAAVSEAVGELVIRAVPGPIEVLIHQGSLSTLREVNQVLVREGRTCLVVREEFGTAIIGPWLLSGRPGCHACLLVRREAALRGDSADLAILRQLEKGGPPVEAGWAGGPARHFVAALVAREVAAMLETGRVQAQEAILSVRLDSLETRRRPFLPNPLCPVCGRPEDDRPEAATLELKSVLKPHPRHYRLLPTEPRLELMEETYLDAEQGLLTGWWRPDTVNEGVLPIVAVSIGAGQRLEGHGRASNPRKARVVALCEALERYGGLRPWGRRTRIRGSFAELAANAVDPSSFGLPPERHPQRSEPSSRHLTRYSPDLTMSWVWAFSFAQNRPVLVPEQIAYHGRTTPPEERFLIETSNGCALGGTLEEAILHGILEVAERDAFLITWHARLAAPRIDLASISDLETVFIVERFQRAHGFRVEAFNITPPEQIPCFWAMAVDESGDATRPRVLCSAGASLDPDRALRSAVSELVPMAGSFCRLYAQESEQQRARRMFACADEVTKMEDHSLVNALPEAWPRFGFLDGPVTPLKTAFEHFYQQPPEMNLTTELRGLTARYLEQGLDVLVVDQTCPEHRRVGLHCVKVLIPGTLPMTFGHDNRRLDLERLRTVPVRLGHCSHALTDAEIHCDPHPFL